MTGGVVYVSGPEGDMNNATDYANTFVVTGGIIIATGSSGMYQSISEGSSCGSIDYITSSGIAAGTKCSLAQNGENLLTFEAEKRCAAILIAGEGIVADNDYTLTIGDSAETVTANKGGSYQGFSFGGRKDGFFGGGMGPRGEKDFEGMMPPNGSDFEGVMPPDGSGFDGMIPPDGDEFKGNPYGSKPEKDKKGDKNNGL